VAVLTPETLLERAAGDEAVSGVGLLDIPASYPEILNDVEDQMADVMRSGHFVLGPKVTALEKKVAEYCQAPYAVGVSSGTDALLIALMAAEIGAGDEVITTPYTFFATVGSIVRLGARPVFVDIDEATFNIDPAALEAAVTERTRAILPVHLYGQAADMDPIMDIAGRHGLTVIEDAAQGIGTEYKNRRAGSFSRFGCFSFFPTKNLGGFGDGGMVTAATEDDWDRVNTLRVHGSQPKYYHKFVGGNFRLDALQAAVVLAKIKHLPAWTERRRANAERYRRLFEEAGLASRVGLPREVFAGHTYNQFVIRVGERRDGLREHLAKNKVGTEIYYPLPLHLQECFKGLGHKPGDFPESEKASRETLALPISQEVTAGQQEYVVEAIARFMD
jgi:dTDP-4-amino-4,6-dideoxygalactose transaminase